MGINNNGINLEILRKVLSSNEIALIIDPEILDQFKKTYFKDDGDIIQKTEESLNSLKLIGDKIAVEYGVHCHIESRKQHFLSSGGYTLYPEYSISELFTSDHVDSHPDIANIVRKILESYSLDMDIDFNQLEGLIPSKKISNVKLNKDFIIISADADEFTFSFEDIFGTER